MNSSAPTALDALTLLAGQAPVAVEIRTDSEGVCIRLQQPPLSFHHSFISGALAKRARQSNQALIRACNNKSRTIDAVLDLTAGWGADSLTLANHGKQVTLLEQNVLVHAVLDYSLTCLAQESASPEIAGLMHLEATEAGSYLRNLTDDHAFDCIYLDPMFPARKSSAKPAKEMQILQALTHNLEIETCFDLARQKARKRVVVKRPAKAPHLASAKPDIVYREKTIRFDVYLTG
jgi:16S rRNA (guanine1516-N2)-methyltransferase